MSDDPKERGGDFFATTRWTQVLAARTDSPAARAALSDLCAAYYAPVHAYIARTARDLGDPRDLTHEFFARILAGAMLSGANREVGRFRAYLLGAVKHFLADARARFLAQKRGAQHEHLPLDSGTDTSHRLDPPAPEGPTPDVWFDRQWGLAVLSQALAALAAEYEQKGKVTHFEALKPWLTSDAPMLSQASAASQLGMTEGALKVAIHRLRLRFRELVKERIGETVENADEVRDELRYLIEVAS